MSKRWKFTMTNIFAEPTLLFKLSKFRLDLKITLLYRLFCEITRVERSKTLHFVSVSFDD